MAEIICDLESQKDKKIFLADRIVMRQIRNVARLEATSREGWGDEAFEALYKAYAELVPRWEFVGGNGEPLPQPQDDPWAFDELMPDEFVWLTNTIFSTVASPNPRTG